MTDESNNVVRVKFKRSITEQLWDALHTTIMNPDYDECTISECLGILVMLQQELYERHRTK